MSDTRRVTIRDVAARAGVAVSTVSYVLNDRGSVAPATRLRVQAAIDDLGFEPNEAARHLRRAGAASVGLVVPDLRNAFFALVTEGVQAAALRRDVLVVLCATDWEEGREADYARLLRSERLTGVIYLSGSGLSPRSVVELATLEPVVFVDERLPGLDVPFVGTDNRGGAAQAARHVLQRGHRRLGVVGGPSALWSAEQRLAGYREAIAAAGLDPDEVPVVAGDYRQESGRLAAHALLGGGAGPDRPTALLCANDLMAFGALVACRELGLDVPGDVSLVGFDDNPMAAMVEPGLTTVRQDGHEMGRRALALLLDGTDSDGPLPADLVVRGSVLDCG